MNRVFRESDVHCDRVLSCSFASSRTSSFHVVERRSLRGARCARRARRRSFETEPGASGLIRTVDDIHTLGRSRVPFVDRDSTVSLRSRSGVSNERVAAPRRSRGRDHGIHADRHSPHRVRIRCYGDRSMPTWSTVRDPVRESSENATHIGRSPGHVVAKSNPVQSPAGAIRGDPSVVACAAFGDAS